MSYDYGQNVAPNVRIQWKGTDVCFDFSCECGESAHYDGYNAYAVRCPHCRRKYDLPYEVPLNTFSGDFEASDLLP